MTDTRDSQFLKLETTGRKTSLSHIVELRFAFVGSSYYVIAGSKRSDWILNATRSGKARIRRSGFVEDAAAALATPSEASSAEAEFMRKYGRVFDEWYPLPRTCLRLTPTGNPISRGKSSGELEAKTTYSEWAKRRSDFYSDVGAAFDSASEEYDFTIRHNFINTWIRKRSIAVLRPYLKPDDMILEVGSGTGAEALEIIRFVRQIVAIDISEKMVELLKAKAKTSGYSERIRAYRLAASEVSGIPSEFHGGRVRVSYSFNGALNCEPKVGAFVSSLHEILATDGYFLCSIRNTICASEMLSHALVLQFDRATPRKKQPSMVSVGGEDIPSTYYSPNRFREFFEPRFKLLRTMALPGFLPPAYLSNYYLKARSVLAPLERMEPILSERFPFNQLGDQTLFIFQKVG